MSITNPDKPITKQDLNDYHNKILPYLGGMPEILANKFAKGDLYDTNEKIIGCWINGKPLYQKTIVVNNPSYTDSSSGRRAFYYSCNVDDVDEPVNILLPAIKWDDTAHFCIAGSMTGDCKPYFTVELYIENNDLVVEICRAKGSVTPTIEKAIATIQYTKTTDQANSFNIGSDTDYSTDEKIIGTWIDGSYLYQKTIDFGSLPNNGSKSVAHGISNLKRVIYFSAIMQNTSSLDGRPIPIYAEGGNNIVSVEYNNTNINIYSSVDRRGYYGYVTIQYIKTT